MNNTLKISDLKKFFEGQGFTCEIQNNEDDVKRWQTLAVSRSGRLQTWFTWINGQLVSSREFESARNK